jgi:hypothetical protein
MPVSLNVTQIEATQENKTNKILPNRVTPQTLIQNFITKYFTKQVF